MSLNAVPSSERIHIGIFGRRNAGKSSIINAVTDQNLAIVSDVLGTTTDPVSKAMELLPLGPVVIIDTPGLDDVGELGSLRVQKAYQVLNKTDIAILVTDASVGMTREDIALLAKIREKGIPYVVVKNKVDLCGFEKTQSYSLENITDLALDASNCIEVSTVTGHNIHELKELIANQVPVTTADRSLVSDLIAPLDLVVLVIPIDASAPKGRLILPQQQTIREILETGASAVTVRETELADTLKAFNRKPRLVITDSQVFAKVSAITPSDIPLTSFSILFARYKGNLATLAAGANAIDTLEENDHVLICEGCTHHRQCEDIGTVKIPHWLKEYTGKELRCTFTSGTDFPDDLSPYTMIIHCGGCTLNEREMKYRIQCAKDRHIPITNYGIAIAHMKGILARSLEIFSNL